MADDAGDCDSREGPRADRRAQTRDAADGAEQLLPLFEQVFPHDDRPRKAIEAARAWARGEIRVGEARRAALAAHAAARAAAGDCVASWAARAAGHAAATAHVATHARGVEFYAAKIAAARRAGEPQSDAR